MAASNWESQQTLEALEARVRALLPEEYQDRYEEVQPVSMGSAGLKYADDGKVAWDEIWETFCDLAMAGGPPHKGKLLEPGTRAEIDARPEEYARVVDEICRGVQLVTGMEAEAAPIPGWVRLECENSTMADWLVRAIVMENISAHWIGATLDLPAGPGFRVEKEIKNVITSIAKTCHYWNDHMWLRQQREIGTLLSQLALELPLVQPALAGVEADFVGRDEARAHLAEQVERATGLRASEHQYAAWLGFTCPHVRAAVWMMRALVASNILTRREETVLFVPLNAATDPKGEAVARGVTRVHGFARAKGVL